jgi:hypothetical protein
MGGKSGDKPPPPAYWPWGVVYAAVFAVLLSFGLVLVRHDYIDLPTPPSAADVARAGASLPPLPPVGSEPPADPPAAHPRQVLRMHLAGPAIRSSAVFSSRDPGGFQVVWEKPACKGALFQVYVQVGKQTVDVAADEYGAAPGDHVVYESGDNFHLDVVSFCPGPADIAVLAP